MKEKKEKVIYKVGDIVEFQAYKEHEPGMGEIRRIGTLKDLNRSVLDNNDTRVFYELYTVGSADGKEYMFTCTTAKWIINKVK